MFLFSDDLTEKEIEIKLEISKKAGLLRKPCKFTDVSGRIDEKIEQNEALGNQYIDRNPVHRFAYFKKNLTDYVCIMTKLSVLFYRSIQVSADCSLHEINTFRAEYLSQGMNHFEGGWPKDINPAENDQTSRFRKKIEKDDGYINSVLSLCQVCT